MAERENEKGTEEARDLIERLLMKDPRRRLGCTKGATEIKRHSFFDGIKWSLTHVKRQGGLWRWCKRLRCLLKNNSKSKRNYYYNYVDSKSYSKVRKCS